MMAGLGVATAYRGRANHHAVLHSLGEYVRGEVHTNGIESLWSMLKRGYVGTYHKMSDKHLHRYVAEFAGRHNMRPDHTENQIVSTVAAMNGKRLPYAVLVADGPAGTVAEQDRSEPWQQCSLSTREYRTSMAHTPNGPDPARADSRKRELAEPIPDSFENVVGAVLATPNKKNWRYDDNR